MSQILVYEYLRSKLPITALFVGAKGVQQPGPASTGGWLKQKHKQVGKQKAMKSPYTGTLGTVKIDIWDHDINIIKYMHDPISDKKPNARLYI